MLTTLVRNPLRTSLSMLDGHDTVPVVMIPDSPTRPLGYAFATWDADPGTVDPTPGYYDPESQTWFAPGGVINAGLVTKTRTSNGTQCGDCASDDACS